MDSHRTPLGTLLTNVLVDGDFLWFLFLFAPFLFLFSRLNLSETPHGRHMSDWFFQKSKYKKNPSFFSYE